MEETCLRIESGSVVVVDFQNDLRTAATELAELEDEWTNEPDWPGYGHGSCADR